MNISILLPYKENYSREKAGAVSLFVNDTSNISKFKRSITIFGSTISKKFLTKTKAMSYEYILKHDRKKRLKIYNNHK